MGKIHNDEKYNIFTPSDIPNVPLKCEIDVCSNILK